MQDILNKYTGKNILIWGYGREGKSTEDFFKKHDIASSVEISEARPDELDYDKYDYIFKSPGIKLTYPTFEGYTSQDTPEKQAYIFDKITSQTELFIESFRDRVVGITGTKGKSTTTSLLHHVLKSSYLVGNIGVPCLDYYDEMATSDNIAVFELSCHQLAYTRVSPHIAIFLNLYEDHLDFYGDRNTYFQAKKHITEFQNKGDYLYLGTDVPQLNTDANTVKITDPYEDDAMNILGKHNHYNAAFVAIVARERFGLSDEEIRSSIEDFSGLPHRLQYVATIDGIMFYDDSISTIPEATIQAIESVPNTKTVLIGGMDREIDYRPLIEFIPAHQDINFICMYASGKRIYEEINGEKYPHIHLVVDLESAVKLSKNITESGKSVVLSPAAASYGYFKNFEERGDVFTTLVKGE